jgi:TrmH family RNA methyltransferase
MITSTSNPRIREACKLQRARQRKQQGRLLIEGLRLVDDAWHAGVRPETVFFAPDTLAANLRAQTLLAELDARGIDCVPCADKVLAALAETVTPQGIAAVIPLPALPLPAQPSLVMVLDRVREPGNAGTLLRTAEAAGVELAIFAPNTVDPFNDKAVRAGMGAHFRLPLHVCATWAEVTELLGPERPRYLADAAGELAYDEVDWRHPAVLVIGGEADGASEDANRAATLITIPMLGATESLNAGVAGAVILFEAARQRRTR